MSEVNQNVNNAEYEDVYDPMLLDDTGKDMVQALAGISQGIGELAEKIHPAAEDIPTSAIPGEDNVEDALKAVDDKIEGLDGTVVKTVNAIRPDENGELKLTKVAYADNLTSDKTQNSEGEFVIRTAGGDASISDGDAFVMRVYGNRVHEGYVPESLSMNVAMAERVTPDPITAVLDTSVFEAYVSEAGTYTLSYTNAWDKTPGDYGVTVTGTPLSGDQIVITWDGESEPYMEVYAPRVAPDPISAAINRDTFVGYVVQSGVTTLIYTTVWSANPALYGVTVTGTPVSGDTITITYYKEERGTIRVATPTALKSTGWNLYNHAAGYAYLTKYSSQYGFRIGGAYTALQYSETLTGAKTAITPVDGVFTIPDDGYVWVTGGNGTDTYIINQWSDWTEGPAGEFEAYSETVVDLSTVMSTYFPNGLLRVGVIRDEINLNASVAISKIDRMAYSAENLAAAKASGRAFEYDMNYIYIVKASYVTSAIVLDGFYTASDHGNEFFTGSEIPVYLETMYGNNLKNKLERDVVQISQQTLTAAQKAQVLQNVGAASQSGLNKLKFITHNDLGSLDAIKADILAVASEMESEEVRPYGVYVNGSASPFQTGKNYCGLLIVEYKSAPALHITVNLTSNNGDLVVIGYNSGTWTINSLNDNVIALSRHTRKTDFSLSDLQAGVAEQNLAKYGLKPGDYKTINGYDYVIAGLGVMKGTHAYTCTSNHVGLIVIPHTTCKWNASGSTVKTADDGTNRGGGYKNCDLHKYLVDTVLPHVQNDLGSSHLYQHKKLLSNAVDASRYNRFGQATGASSGWEWVDCYISALTEAQVFGGDHWSSSGYDTGEANTLLPVFAEYKHTEIFGNEYPWLRNVSSASRACFAHNAGYATGDNGVSNAYYVAGLILYH